MGGTKTLCLSSLRERLSVRKVVVRAMKGTGVAAVVAVALGASALIANADVIKKHIRFHQKKAPQVVQHHNVALAPIEHRIMHMKFSAAPHETPDALVYIPAGYDYDRPLNVLIYNHGLTDDVDRCFSFWELDKAMQYAPPNTVMIMPEWASQPHAYGSAAGPYHQPGFFRNMLAEILKNTPELRNESVDDINKITIATFSGGFRATRTQIERNGLEDKVAGLIVLDSLYESNYFDNWLSKNVRELAAGRKFYQNFYFDTVGNSMQQAARLKGMLRDAGLPESAVYVDSQHEKEVVGPDVIRQHPICFIYTTIYSDERTAHQSAAYLYFPEALKAIAASSGGMRIASKDAAVPVTHIE